MIVQVRRWAGTKAPPTCFELCQPHVSMLPDATVDEAKGKIAKSEEKIMLDMRQRDSRPYRQGDVLLVPCDKIPAEAHEEVSENGRVILARGERTGHSHTMTAERVSYFREDGSGSGGAFIRVTGLGPVALMHEEHAPLSIPPGDYRVIQQREYQPRETPRVVSD